MAATIPSITSVFHELPQAIKAYDWLRANGYTIPEISVLMSDKTAPLFHKIEGDDNVERKRRSAPGTESSGAVGAGIGAGITGAVAIGLSLITGGPLGLALAASLPGAMFGGLLGGLVGQGFPEASAQAYDEAIRNGAVAIGVTPKSPEQAQLVQKKFEELHGKNVLVL